MHLNADQAVENENITFVNTQSKEADFESLCTGFYMKTTADVYVAFDRPAQSGDFLLASTDGVVSFEGVKGTSISALGVSGGGTLYIMGTR